jgi:hypothetical protein
VAVPAHAADTDHDDTDAFAGYGGAVPAQPGTSVPAPTARPEPGEPDVAAALNGPTLAVPTTGGGPQRAEPRLGPVPLRVEYLGGIPALPPDLTPVDREPVPGEQRGRHTSEGTA